MHRKPLTIPKLIKKADAIFSRLVRMAGADANGMCQCVSCGRMNHWKKIHAGHFASRTHGATRFDLENVHPQCCYCNTFSAGNPAGYGSYIKNRYGVDKIDEIWQRAKAPHKWDREKLIEFIKVTTEAAKRIQKEKGLE